MRENRPTYLRYPGGKSKALHIIDPYIPTDFEEYREPFCGGASVFLLLRRRYPDRQFWINDLNKSVYAFWRTAQMRNQDMVQWLLNVKIMTANLDGTRNDDLVKLFFKECRRDIAVTKDEFLRGAMFYYLNKTSFSGLTETGTCSLLAWDQNFGVDGINALRELEPLLKGVRITNKNYSALIPREDDPSLIFYFDPPYDLNKVNASLYGRDGQLHKGFDHELFFATLKNCRCRFLVTYNSNPNIRQLAEAQHLIVAEEQLRYTMRQSKAKVEGAATETVSKMGTELFITNFQVGS